MELSLGIHGEPGAAVVDLQPVDIVISHVLNQILLKATSIIYCPLNFVTRVCEQETLRFHEHMGPYQCITNLVETVSTGFSISIVKADESILKQLDAPSRVPSWPVGADGVRPPAKIPLNTPKT
ncbi:hypothetical protein MKW98_026019 [Papaver atlanticum]|uniref:DhaK domain-containing protein n=1 Tax=Papaver atlanticum TaxID=357466 RepID=A0AAD4RYA9_9MAGN|nr:hypothetical protein MKW98_026019 [Papaver atlanticum]